MKKGQQTPAAGGQQSYLERRLAEYGITDEQNRWAASDDEGHSYPNWRFFTQKGDDIQINYLSPEGQTLICFRDAGRRHLTEYSRTRLANPREGQPKYLQPRSSEPVPFCTPAVLEAVRRQQPVERLFVVEGEFKAFAMSMAGLPAMAIAGIHNYKARERTEMHPYIADFIRQRGVKEVVLVFDADAVRVEWREDKDLYTRPNLFYTAVDQFNELLKPLDVQLYFAHVLPDRTEKGIDDVLNALRGRRSEETERKALLKELQQGIVGQESRKYVQTYQITGKSSTYIKSIFGIVDVNQFWERYALELADKDFVWRGARYHEENGRLVQNWLEQPQTYLRIGVDYFKKVLIADKHGRAEVELRKWSVALLRSDYKKGASAFIDQIPTYDALANLPENNPEKYRQTIVVERDGIKSRLYNLYNPVIHKPRMGQWSTIDRFLHHIFDYRNTDGVPLYEFGLDYLQLIYTRPTQNLPILSLVSKERATGKTTFLNLLKYIYGENMRILDSERISSQFNASWAGKLIVSVDETLIATDKAVVTNKIKTIATAEKIQREGKGEEPREVDNISKLIMCSNDETNFTKIDNEESRFCVIKVHPVPQEDNDVDLLEKMKREVPAFLHFLRNRQLNYDRVSRLWFDEHVYLTPAGQLVKERTENGLYRCIKDIVIDQFFKLARIELKLPLKCIYTDVRKEYRNATKRTVSNYFADRGVQKENMTTYQYYDNDSPIGQILEGRDRVYKLYAKDWLTPDELADLEKDNIARLKQKDLLTVDEQQQLELYRHDNK